MLNILTAGIVEQITHWTRSGNRTHNPSRNVVQNVAGKNRRASEGRSLHALGLILALALAFASGHLSAQPCAPPPAGLVGWWPLDETTGTFVSDLSGLGNNGTATGTIGPNSNPRSGAGFVGGGLQFFMSSHVTITASNSLDFFGTTGSFTVDAWIKGHASPIVSNIPASFSPGYAVYNDGVSLRFDMADAPLTSFNGPPISQGVWTFIAVVVDRGANKVTLYTGPGPTGALQSVVRQPIPAGFNASGGPLRIGGCPGNPNGCDTIVDEVEVFKRALTLGDIQSIFAAGSTGKCKTGVTKKGMTWFHTASNPQLGTITVGCGPAGPNRCDPIHGDTLCSQPLPLLCIYKPPPPFKQTPPPSLVVPSQYYSWVPGVVATTTPVAAVTFQHSADATTYCVAQFGPGWQVAEFHDGWGWNFQSYGGTVSAPTVPSSRFWVHINDQPSGNCWALP